ncbi:hypothetical protein H257_13214 [Aphanomyces astaci]|uniref:DDE-1 domain-containing protein n=1 Tax=Aphanomyces astaci TaxID=112090 RepID=W4FVM3_APHAT|nr:hypothetical protein H257_13214 [Aphanomyces astaci]ETV71550.1 hypothetical protein H257_13214 [Aphanomyces astaci]|eukprot:XP_009838983.1 hypothetical protein H257_13214 [Aphanomyces astaci]
MASMSDYKVSENIGIPRSTIRSWFDQRDEFTAFQGNKKRMKVSPGGRREMFPDPKGLVDFIVEMRVRERALTTTHIINWIKRYQSQWLRLYLVDKQAGTGYQSLLRLLQQFCRRHGCSRQRAGHRKKSHWLKSATSSIACDAKVSSGEMHSLRMTVALTVRGRIEMHELPTYPSGHVYAVQQKAWMDNNMWKLDLRTLLLPCIEAQSVILADNFESHRAMAPFKRFLRDERLAEEIIDGEDEDEFYSPCAVQKRLAMINRAIGAWEKVSEDVVRARALSKRFQVLERQPLFDILFNCGKSSTLTGARTLAPCRRLTIAPPRQALIFNLVLWYPS